MDDHVYILMPTIQIQSEISFDTLLGSVEQLDTNDLEYFAEQVLAIRARRRAPSLPHAESELLQKINQGLLPEVQQRFNDLTKKRRAETLTTDEHRELLELIDQIEQNDVQRIEHLAKLAQMRNIPIRTLIQQLGIHSPQYA